MASCTDGVRRRDADAGRPPWCAPLSDSSPPTGIRPMLLLPCDEIDDLRLRRSPLEQSSPSDPMWPLATTEWSPPSASIALSVADVAAEDRRGWPTDGVAAARDRASASSSTTSRYRSSTNRCTCACTNSGVGWIRYRTCSENARPMTLAICGDGTHGGSQGQGTGGATGVSVSAGARHVWIKPLRVPST